MKELGRPYPGMQCVLPRNTIVYDFHLELNSIGHPRTNDEVHRVHHHTIVMVISAAPTIELTHYSLYLVPVLSSALLGWVYNRNIRSHV